LNKKVTSLVLAVCVLLSCIAVGSFSATAGTEEVAVAAQADDESVGANYGLASQVKDGNILHCFDWKYNDIKAELPNIAKAGFTSVQTSPVQTPDPLGQWYGLYLPREFKCTSGPLGTRDDLKNLCSEADNYGIKIVCDVVANHLTGDHANIQDDLKDGQYWHKEFDVSDWNDRYQITNGKIGMADLNTGHSHVQTVVFNYLQDLKSIGVDGFRFDAAKHIGLPSEGDGFWAKIAGIGIYRYGEILDSPGGDANKVMNEYAQYIGVTDSDYSGAITGAIRDGKVVENNGNWVNRGISADKIVYWGESHDTYSNDPPPKEGGWTKYLDQNIIDRAYAVVGAKANSQSLYLSRPFNKDKTSIMSGQKGSTHFTSAEVAAVNHFHNAMVGTKEYYTTGNNCFVVCREGGAVIVAASGSNFDVTVPNGGSIVKQGTYTDEVSGSTWTVTGSNISGKIGTSGIAVIYSSKPAGPSASVTPGSSKYKTDSLTLTLSYENATSGSYSIDGGAYQNYTKGQTITIGAGKPVGTKTTVSVKASDGTNTSDPETYTYTKSDNSAQMVYFDNSSYNWSSVYAYIYGNKTEVAAWPGTQMQKDSTGYFALEVPEGFEEGNIIFTESKDAVDHRYPADKDPGLPLEGTTKIFKANHQFVDYDPPVPTTPVPTTAAPTTAPVGKILIGDTNGDSKITVSDATLIQMHAAGMQKLTGDRLTAADTNKDGSVNVGDATMVQLYLVYDKSSSNYTGTWIGGGVDPTQPQPTTSYVQPTTAYIPPTTAAPSSGVTLDASATSKGTEDWYAWTWDSGSDGRWIKGSGSASSVQFSGNIGKSIIFVRLPQGESPSADWGNIWNQTNDLTTKMGGTFKTTGWADKYMNGEWQ